MNKNYFQTSIKIPNELYEKIQKESQEEERNITGQIIYIIKQYYKDKQ